MGSLRKANCTPEEWASYLAQVRERRAQNLERENARIRAYNARPDVIERRREREMTSAYRDKRLARETTPEQRAKAKERYAKRRADPEHWRKVLAKQRRNRTGFSPELIAELMAAQEGRCAVCDREFEGRQVRADHCHDLNQPRGLLCHHCNIIEGMLKGMALTPIEFGKRLEHYLVNPPASKVPKVK